MQRLPKKVFCLAGYIAVGKTTIAEHLTSEFDAHHFRTAKLLAKRARAAGTDTTKYSNALIAREGQGALMGHLISEINDTFSQGGNQNMTIDGLYRPHDLKAIREAFPSSKVYVIYVTAPRILRIGRFAKRENLSVLDAKKKVDEWDQALLHGFNALPGIAAASDIKLHNLLQSKEQLKKAISKALLWVD